MLTSAGDSIPNPMLADSRKNKASAPKPSRRTTPRSPDPSTLGLEGDMVGLTGLLNMKSPLSVLATDMDVNLKVHPSRGLAAKTPRRSLLSALATAIDSPMLQRSGSSATSLTVDIDDIALDDNASASSHSSNRHNQHTSSDSSSDTEEHIHTHQDIRVAMSTSLSQPIANASTTSTSTDASDSMETALALHLHRSRPFVRTSTASGRLESRGSSIRFDLSEPDSPTDFSPEPLPRTLFLSQPCLQQQDSSPESPRMSLCLPRCDMRCSSPQSEDSMTLLDFAKDDQLADDMHQDSDFNLSHCSCVFNPKDNADDPSEHKQCPKHRDARRHNHGKTITNTSLVSNSTVHSGTTGGCTSASSDFPGSPSVSGLSLSSFSPPKRFLDQRLTRHASLPAIKDRSTLTSPFDASETVLQPHVCEHTSFLDQDSSGSDMMLKVMCSCKPPLPAMTRNKTIQSANVGECIVKTISHSQAASTSANHNVGNANNSKADHSLESSAASKLHPKAGLFAQRGVLHWNQQQRGQTQRKQALNADASLALKPPRIPNFRSKPIPSPRARSMPRGRPTDTDSGTSQTQTDTKSPQLTARANHRCRPRPYSPMDVDGEQEMPVVTTNCRSNKPHLPRPHTFGADRCSPINDNQDSEHSQFPVPPHKMRRSNTIPVLNVGQFHDASSGSADGHGESGDSSVMCVPLKPIPDPCTEESLLPSTLDRNKDMIRRISVQTLVDVLDGRYNNRLDEFHLIDCRYAYEYTGGHIACARNITQPDVLEDMFFRTPPDPFRRIAVVFHCEYSAQRAPQMALHFRSVDRNLNAMAYPRLHYPDIYVLQGGYNEFFAHHQSRCQPCGYIQMNDEAYMEEYKASLAVHRRQFRKSFSDGFLR